MYLIYHSGEGRNDSSVLNLLILHPTPPVFRRFIGLIFLFKLQNVEKQGGWASFSAIY
jgi:hypothetical protein